MFALALVTALASTAGRALPLTHTASNEELMREKRGQVVDTRTGAGIPNATVVAMWRVHGGGGWSSGGACLVRRFEHTNADGGYVIPEMAREDLDLSTRTDVNRPSFFSTRWRDYDWKILVYLPGYVREGDLADFRSYPTTGPRVSPDGHYQWPETATAHFKWEVQSASVDEVGQYVRVSPLRMAQAVLTPSQQIIYFDHLLREISSCDVMNPSGELTSIRADVSARVRLLPCQMAKAQPVEGELVRAFELLLGDERLRNNLKASGAIKSDMDYPEMDAGTLCAAVP